MFGYVEATRVRMVPATPGRMQSSAEGRLFTRLAASGVHAVALHSLRLARHEYKTEGEIDFLLLFREGLLVVEVKGGRVRRDEDGIWIYRDRFGEDHRSSEGPIRQAGSAMWSLRRTLFERLPELEHSGYTFGWAAAFPDTDVPPSSPEWDEEVVLGTDRVGAGIEPGAAFAEVMAFYRGRQHRQLPVDPQISARVLSALRPTFDRAPTLRQRAGEATELTTWLTEQQYDRLDILMHLPRIVCKGGAGTGKTFLALEVARRHAEAGEDVILLCPRPMLAAFLRSRVGMSGVRVITPEEAGSVAPSSMLIVDEAQDILDSDGLDLIDHLVHGGVTGGRWRIFLDPNAQAGLYGRFDPAALLLLEEQAVAPVLSQNCRNTVPIVTQVQLLTGADVGTASAGDGPPVEIQSYTNDADCAELLEQRLDRLVDEGVMLGDITILSPRQWEQSSARLLPRRYTSKLSQLDQANAARMPLPNLTFATIADFKGLENSFVLVVDVDHMSDDAADVAQLYVALTRPRVLLWVAVSPLAEAALTEAGARTLGIRPGDRG